jgi:hypothetical protein
MKPFDYVYAINTSKKNLMRDTENDTLAESGYEPWLTNNALSYFPDTILYANVMNMYGNLDKRPQFEYLLNSIRPKKRFSKWVKNTNNEDLVAIRNYYNCNLILAREYMSLLSKKQIDIIRETQEQGG